MTTASSATIGVLIVDDHRMFAETTARVLRDEPDIDPVQWVTTVEDALSRVGKGGVDVVLMDYHLPDGNGITAAREIRERHAETRVVLVTGSDDERLLPSALDAGCSGYVRKAEDVTSLGVAIRAAHAGLSAVSPYMLTQALTPKCRASSDADALNGRELAILRLLAAGMGLEEMAGELFLSPNTVRNYTQSILEKLDAHSKLEAVIIALNQRIIELPQPVRRRQDA